MTSELTASPPSSPESYLSPQEQALVHSNVSSFPGGNLPFVVEGYTFHSQNEYYRAKMDLQTAAQDRFQDARKASMGIVDKEPTKTANGYYDFETGQRVGSDAQGNPDHSTMGQVIYGGANSMYRQKQENPDHFVGVFSTQQGQFPAGQLVVVTEGKKPENAGQLIGQLQGTPFNPGRLTGSLPGDEATYLARTGRANFQDVNGNSSMVTYQHYDSFPLASKSPYLNANVPEMNPGDLIIRGAISKQENANIAISRFFGEQNVPIGFNADYGKDFLRGIGAFVPKMTAQTLAGGEMLYGEVIARGYNLFHGDFASTGNRNKEFASAAAIVPIEFGKGIWEQAKTGSGAGELAGALLTGKLLPGQETNIEVIKFKEVKIEQVGKYTDAFDAATKTIGRGGNVERMTAGGTSEMKISVIGEKEVIPFSRESFDQLRGKEADYLAVRGNKEAVIATNAGDFGVLKDIDRTFLVRNPFKEPIRTPEFNTIPGTKGNIVENRYAFPLSDAPKYPLQRLPRFEEVSQQNPLVKQSVTPEEFLSADSRIAASRDFTMQVAAENARNQGGYIVPDTFFEKFTPTIGENGLRQGADFFTESGVKRLQAPSIDSSARIASTEAELYVRGNFADRKVFVGRSVTTEEKFTFSNPKDVESFNFAQVGNTKIVSGFNRPRDVLTDIERIDSSGKVPKTMDVTKVKNRDDLSYYPIEIKRFGITKKGYVGVMNDADARAFSNDLFKTTSQEDLPRIQGVSSSSSVKKTSGGFDREGGIISILDEAQQPSVNPLDGMTRIRGKPILDVNIIKENSGFVILPLMNTRQSMPVRNALTPSSSFESIPIYSSETSIGNVSVLKNNFSLVNAYSPINIQRNELSNITSQFNTSESVNVMSSVNQSVLENFNVTREMRQVMPFMFQYPERNGGYTRRKYRRGKDKKDLFVFPLSSPQEVFFTGQNFRSISSPGRERLAEFKRSRAMGSDAFPTYELRTVAGRRAIKNFLGGAL